MAAGRPGEEAFGRPLVALLREEKVNGLAGVVQGAVEIPPVPFDPDVGFVQAPAEPHLFTHESGFYSTITA
jgi:hypothetical protein